VRLVVSFAVCKIYKKKSMNRSAATSKSGTHDDSDFGQDADEAGQMVGHAARRWRLMRGSHCLASRLWVQWLGKVAGHLQETVVELVPIVSMESKLWASSFPQSHRRWRFHGLY
jgi:hypothetical protein